MRTLTLARFGPHCSNLGSTTAKDRCEDLRISQMSSRGREPCCKKRNKLRLEPQSQRSLWSRSLTRRRSSSTIATPRSSGLDRVDKKSFAEFLGDVETYCVLAPGSLARPLLEWAAAFRDQPIVMSDVEAYAAAHGNPFDWNLKEVSEALGPLLHKVCKGSAESS